MQNELNRYRPNHITKIKRDKESDNDSVKRNLLHAKVTGEIDKTHPINKIDTLDFNIGFKVLIK